MIDGEKGHDDSCRPNQVLAISLRHPILDRERWQPVLYVVKISLQTLQRLIELRDQQHAGVASSDTEGAP